MTTRRQSMRKGSLPDTCPECEEVIVEFLEELLDAMAERREADARELERVLRAQGKKAGR